jgi:hypothetical protein
VGGCIGGPVLFVLGVKYISRVRGFTPLYRGCWVCWVYCGDWHAFNLVRSSQTGAYTVQRFGSTGNGAVVSDFQAVVDDLGVNVGGPAVISTVSLGGLGEPCRTGGVCNAGLTCNSGSICR